MALDCCQRLRRLGAQIAVAAHQHLADHARQAHALAVFGAVDARHAVVHQGADLAWHDHAAAAAKHLHLGAAALAQQIDHVLKILHVPALVGADGDALHILLQGGRDHLIDRAVVPQVDDLGPHALQQPAHDVDGGVVAVEQAGGGDEAHLVARAVVGQGLEVGVQVGHGRQSPVWPRRRGVAASIVKPHTLIDVYVNVNEDRPGMRPATAKQKTHARRDLGGLQALAERDLSEKPAMPFCGCRSAVSSEAPRGAAGVACMVALDCAAGAQLSRGADCGGCAGCLAARVSCGVWRYALQCADDPKLQAQRHRALLPVWFTRRDPSGTRCALGAATVCAGCCHAARRHEPPRLGLAPPQGQPVRALVGQREWKLAPDIWV